MTGSSCVRDTERDRVERIQGREYPEIEYIKREYKDMATPEWVEQCLKRREADNKVTVVSDTGNRHQLGGQEIQQRFFFGLCPSCHKIGEHSACSACMMVSYCSRECQKKDWKTHKSLCKILTNIRGSSKTHLFHNDPSAQPRVTQALEMSLGRKLEQHEADILTHARICLVCHR